MHINTPLTQMAPGIKSPFTTIVLNTYSNNTPMQLFTLNIITILIIIILVNIYTG